MRKAATPWARAGSGFTLLFEAYVLALAKSMPIANAAERLGEHDTRLWRIVEHYVWRAVEKLDLSLVRRIAADETSARRGHDYISLFVDMARRKVVYVADGKDAATVKEFADFLEAHGGRREAVTDASIDMGAAFEAGIKENFPNAEITFDKFHVIKLANEAVDQVRREEARNNFQIKGRRYIFVKNVDHLTPGVALRVGIQGRRKRRPKRVDFRGARLRGGFDIIWDRAHRDWILCAHALAIDVPPGGWARLRALLRNAQPSGPSRTTLTHLLHRRFLRG